MNRLSALIKRQKLSDCIKNKHTTAPKYTKRMRVKRNIFLTTQKKIGLSTLILE